MTKTCNMHREQSQMCATIQYILSFIVLYTPHSVVREYCPQYTNLTWQHHGDEYVQKMYSTAAMVVILICIVTVVTLLTTPVEQLFSDSTRPSHI